MTDADAGDIADQHRGAVRGSDHRVRAALGGKLMPVPGGVLVKDQSGAIVGCVGISGDTSDNDELAAIAGIKAASLVAQPD